MASYTLPTPPSGDDTAHRGSELLASAVDAEQLAAYDAVWRARDTAERAALAYAAAIGHAAQVLGVDLATLLDVLAGAGRTGRLVADILALQALPTTTGGDL